MRSTQLEPDMTIVEAPSSPKAPREETTASLADVFLARIADATFKPDWDLLLVFASIVLAPGERRCLALDLSADPRTRGRSVYPVRLYVPAEVASGFEIRNIFIPDGVEEEPGVPLFDGRAFPAELFDGRKDRDLPYGRLPRVPAKPDAVIRLEVKNGIAAPGSFMAVLAATFVLSPPLVAG